LEKITLIFPDSASIVDFILTHRISGIHINSTERSLTATLTSEQVKLAATRYKAHSQKKPQKK
jgi:hypothetical protein